MSIAGASVIGTGATDTRPPSDPSAQRSAWLIALAGVGLIGYGIIFLVVNFTTFIELGLGETEVGATSATALAFSEKYYHYVSHLQVALSGFIAATGVALVAFALCGIRRGEQWAFWSSVATAVTGVAVALPLHYPWGLATIGHLGLIYLDLAVFAAGFLYGLRARYRTA